MITDKKSSTDSSGSPDGSLENTKSLVDYFRMRFPVYSRLSHFPTDDTSRLSSAFGSLTNSRNPSPGRYFDNPDKAYLFSRFSSTGESKFPA